MSGLTHWGYAVTSALRAHGVDTIFTLSGGHIFPIYDAAVAEGIRIFDVRHESTAGFAAEAYGKLSGGVGVAAVTAGPGVFNAINALATAQKNNVPLALIGGRAPTFRWGKGSLQEIDHVPVARSLCKSALTGTAALATELSASLALAKTPPQGPVFVDIPLDCGAVGAEISVEHPPRIAPDDALVDGIAQALSEASSPVLIAGSGVFQDRAWEAMQDFVARARIPVFCNGMGRGTIPADDQHSFRRARGFALKRADLVIVAGAPMDFRLSFGEAFKHGAHVFHLEGIDASLKLAFEALAACVKLSGNDDWLVSLRAAEAAKETEATAESASDAVPIHPLRVYREVSSFLDRDATVVCDGGDFVSFAGRELPSYLPGSWLDPGPFGCLGSGPGYAIAAKLLHPDRQVALLFGDGAFGFSGMEFDTMVRHKVPVVSIMGNNGIWGLEKHPMKAMFGHDVAADLAQGTRYDEVVRALGGHGEFVEEPGEIRPALERARASGLPSLVNILIDPTVAYPRSANLA